MPFPTYWAWIAGTQVHAELTKAAIRDYFEVFSFPTTEANEEAANRQIVKTLRLLERVIAIAEAGEFIGQQGSLSPELTIELIREFARNCSESFVTTVGYHNGGFSHEQNQKLNLAVDELSELITTVDQEIEGEGSAGFPIENEEGVEAEE